jgi:membrane-bound lytic murein transglycosylase B
MKIGRYIAVIAVGLLLGVGGSYAIRPAAPAQAQELSPEQRAQLQAQYDQLQKEIEQYQKIIDDTKAKANTIQGDVTILDAQIRKAQAEINQRTSAINTLASTINQKSKTIATLESQLEDGRASLAKLLREKSLSDNTSLVVLALSGGTLTDFFQNADRINAIDASLQEKFDELRGVKTMTEAQKEALAAQQSQQLDAKKDVEAKKSVIDQSKSEKTNLLAATKNDEAAYNKVLADRQAKAAAIKAALFPLRDAAAIQFGDALKFAQAAQRVTGTDAALALAILTQESNLGTNVGQCYMTDDATGNGKGKNTGTPFKGVMNPTRDVPPFLALSRQLGFDPHSQVVSCPIASVGGWGGAMGPAQFIPSTWAMYAARVAAGSGKAVANPWSAQDAIMAMSFLLADNGASAGGYTANFNAAARYYAGWNGPASAAGRSYATQVMAKVAGIQKNIDYLAGI